MTKKTVPFLLTLMVLMLLGGMLYPTPALAADTYQAENAVLGSGAVVQSTYTGYSGTGYVDFPDTYNMAYVDFLNVHGGTGGSARLRLVYALDGAYGRMAMVWVNGVRHNIRFSPTGAWTTWAILEVNVSLNRGLSNTIRLLGQRLPNLDRLDVIPYLTVTTPPPAAAAATMWAGPPQASGWNTPPTAPQRELYLERAGRLAVQRWHELHGI